MKVKQKDFIEIEYTGKLKENDQIFDTTSKDEATKAGIFNPKIDYTPAIVCIGQSQLVGRLDEKLVGKEVGKEYTIELTPEEAFGNKDAKLLKLIPTNVFKKQQIAPAPGMQVNIDNAIGIIRTVTGGRTFVDFNHPLAGKEVTYQVKIHKIVENDEEKIKALMKVELRIKPEHVSFKDSKVVIDSKMSVPKEFTDLLLARIKQIIPNVKSIEFKATEQKPESNQPNV